MNFKYLSLFFLLHLVFIFHLFGQEAKLNSSTINWQQIEKLMIDQKVDEVKAEFSIHANNLKRNHQDSLLISRILVVTNYLQDQNEYAERIRWYQYAIDSLDENKNVELFLIRRKYADIYAAIDEYEDAIKLFKKNFQLLTRVGFKDAQSLEASFIAKMYLKANERAKAEEYYLKSLDIAEKNNIGFYTNLGYNNAGYFYTQIDDKEKAESYYLLGLKRLLNKDTLDASEKNHLYLLLGNLGSLYLQNNVKQDTAIQMLQADLWFNINYGNVLLGIGASVELVDYYIKKNWFKEAEILLNKVLNHERIIEYKEMEEPEMVRFYRQLFVVYQNLGDKEKAFFYFQHYEKLSENYIKKKDVIRSGIEKSLLSNVLSGQLAMSKQQLEIMNTKNKYLTLQKRHTNQFFIMVIITMLIISLLIVLNSRKRLLLSKIKKELAENNLRMERLKNETNQVEIQNKNKNLTDFAINISHQQDVIRDVKTQLIDIKKNEQTTEESKLQIRKLINFINSNLRVDNQRKDMHNNIENINHQFLTILSEKYPELTELDKYICGLIRLGLSNKDIANLRNVTYKAVRISRYRIRKKLNIEEDEDLTQFLKNIG